MDLLSNYNGLLYIFDREEKLLSILNNEASEGNIFFDDEFKKELNGEWSYKFSVDMSKTKDLMLEYNKVGFYDRRGNFQLFVIYDIEDNIGYEAIRTVYCLHDFQSLNEDIICLSPFIKYFLSSSTSPFWYRYLRSR